MQRRFSTAIVMAAALLLSAPAALADDTSDVKATVQRVLAAANVGDEAALGGLTTGGGIVIDEFAPFYWNGISDWIVALGRYNTQNGLTSSRTQLDRIRHVTVSGDRAYAVARVRYFTGARTWTHVEYGTEAFILDRAKGARYGWKVSGFAWASTDGVDAGADAIAIVAAIRKEMDSFNGPNPDMSAIQWKGVIDEFAPFMWSGDRTLAGWGAGFQASGQELLNLKLGDPVHLAVNGDDAYVVLPATIDLKIKGKLVREKGSFAYTMVKTNGVWKTYSWAWALD